MKFTTVTYQAVEMTIEEEVELWKNYKNNTIKGKKIFDWETSDGKNEIKFDGENFYRQVVRKGN